MPGGVGPGAGHQWSVSGTRFDLSSPFPNAIVAFLP